MADEGVFPKSDGDVWYGTDTKLVNDVMQKALGLAINNFATLRRSADVLDSQFSVPDYLMVDDMSEDELVDTETNVDRTDNAPTGEGYKMYIKGASPSYVSIAKNWGPTINYGIAVVNYIVYDVFDCFSDSSIDSSKWDTAGTVSEAEMYLKTGDGGAAETCSCVSKTDLKSGTQTVYIRAYVRARSTTGENSSAKIRIAENAQAEDLGDTVDIISEVTAGIQTNSSWNDLKLVFDESGQTVTVSDIDPVTGSLSAIAGSPFDLSSLSSYYINFYGIRSSTGANNEGYVECLDVRNDVTMKASATSVVTIKLSADNGSNYEAVTNGVVHKFSNTGNNLKLKLELSEGTDEEIEIDSYAIGVIEAS
jgi:hypothetical protein